LSEKNNHRSASPLYNDIIVIVYLLFTLVVLAVGLHNAGSMIRISETLRKLDVELSKAREENCFGKM